MSGCLQTDGAGRLWLAEMCKARPYTCMSYRRVVNIVDTSTQLPQLTDYTAR